MSSVTVAILSPGDMGHAVGKTLKDHGNSIVTCVEGRSKRTRGLAIAAGFVLVPSIEAMIEKAELILSIIPSESVLATAREIAEAMEKVGKFPVYADCNAIAPATSLLVHEEMERVGATYIDVGIIGNPPGKGPPPRFYASGPDISMIAGLNGMGIDVRSMGEVIGQGSAIKMCYAGLTKGTNTLRTAVLLTGEALGVGDELGRELADSQAAVYENMRKRIPGLPPDAKRWISEMHEIARAFDDAGVTPRFHEGAAEIFRVLAATPFAQEFRETVDQTRTVEELIEVASRHL